MLNFCRGSHYIRYPSTKDCLWYNIFLEQNWANFATPSYNLHNPTDPIRHRQKSSSFLLNSKISFTNFICTTVYFVLIVFIQNCVDICFVHLIFLSFGFCILVTLVAWFSFRFICRAHLALQNVNKDYVIFMSILHQLNQSL